MRRIVTIILLAGLLACGDDENRSTGLDEDELGSPEQLTQSLAAALVEGDRELYERMVAGDFRFVFDPTEQELSGTPDATWDRSLALEAAQSFLEPASAKTARMTFEYLTLTPLENEWTDVGEGTLRRRFEFEAQLRELGALSLQLNSVSDLFVRQLEDDYVLVRWEEHHPNANLGAAGLTELGMGALKVRARNLWIESTLINELERAFEERRFVLYDSLRGADFLFEFAAADIGSSGNPSGIWDRAKDSEAISSMYQGQPGHSVPAVQSILFELAPVDASWRASTEPEFTGSWLRSYELDAIILLTTQDRFEVRGRQDFYIEQDEDRYRLLHWRDQGYPATKSTEAASLGAVKSLY